MSIMATDYREETTECESDTMYCLQTNMKQILIVDDHPVVRQGLKQLIDQEEGYCVCSEAADEDEALANIEEYDPDIVIVDLVLKSTSGLELIRSIQRLWPSLPILVLSMHDESLYAERALRAGARGYVMKQEVIETLMTGIARVLSGGIYVSDRMTKPLVDVLAGDRPDIARLLATNA